MCLINFSCFLLSSVILVQEFIIVNFAADLPRVILADDCPAGPSVRRGYILVDTLATCKCQLKMAGYTPGFAQWYKNGSKIGTNEEDGSAVLTIQYNDKGNTKCTKIIIPLFH
jgi:hypothetical protein